MARFQIQSVHQSSKMAVLARTPITLTTFYSGRPHPYCPKRARNQPSGGRFRSLRFRYSTTHHVQIPRMSMARLPQLLSHPPRPISHLPQQPYSARSLRIYSQETRGPETKLLRRKYPVGVCLGLRGENQPIPPAVPGHTGNHRRTPTQKRLLWWTLKAVKLLHGTDVSQGEKIQVHRCNVTVPPGPTRRVSTLLDTRKSLSIPKIKTSIITLGWLKWTFYPLTVCTIPSCPTDTWAN